MNEEKKIIQSVCFRMPTEVYWKVRKMNHKEGTTLQGVLRTALNEYLERREKKENE